MFYKFLLLFVSFYFLALIQNSFLVHFSILGATPDLILIVVCLFSFFEKSKTYFGIASAIIGGLFLDILSEPFIGISIFSLLIIYFVIKEVLHHLTDVWQKYFVLYFIPILIFSTIIYGLFLGLFSYFFNHSSLLYSGGYAILVKIIYNLALGLVGFYIFKRFLMFFNAKK